VCVYKRTACAASGCPRHACAFSQVQVSKAARKEAGQLKTQLTEISSNLKATVEELNKEKSSGERHRVHPCTVSAFVLCCAVLCCAVLCCAVLCCAGPDADIPTSAGPDADIPTSALKTNTGYMRIHTCRC